MLGNFISSDRVVVVGFFRDQACPQYPILEAVARVLSSTLTFGAVTDLDGLPEELRNIAGEAPKIVVFRKFEEPRVVYEGPFVSDDISEFVLTHSKPLVDDISPENYASYSKSALPLGFVFYTDAAERGILYPTFFALATEFRDRMNFVFVDSQKYSAHAKNLNLVVGKWPAFAIHSITSNKKFPHPQDKPLTLESCHALVKGVLDGSLTPVPMSEPEPASNNGPVKTVVGSTFDKIVLDPTYDVLVEFYAPWCGHCKELAPVLEELGQLMLGDSHVVIAKMDATANDVPDTARLELQGFPTLALYRADNKGEPLLFKKERNLVGLLQFLQANAHHKDKIIHIRKADGEEPDILHEEF